MRYLTRREADIIEVIGQTLLPEDSDLGVGTDAAGVVLYLDDYISQLGFIEQLKLRALFQIMEFGIAVTTANPLARFTQADENEREDYLLGWANSPNPSRRAVFQGLRSIITMAYFSSPQVQSAIGEQSTESVLGQLKDVVSNADGAIKDKHRDGGPVEPVTDVRIEAADASVTPASNDHEGAAVAAGA